MSSTVLATKKTRTYPTIISRSGNDPEITISTGAPDREGDVLVPEGAHLENYLRNPVVLFGHRHDALPVASGSCSLVPLRRKAGTLGSSGYGRTVGCRGAWQFVPVLWARTRYNIGGTSVVF